MPYREGCNALYPALRDLEEQGTLPLQTQWHGAFSCHALAVCISASREISCPLAVCPHSTQTACTDRGMAANPHEKQACSPARVLGLNHMQEKTTTRI
jgi:hypothetical protein